MRKVTPLNILDKFSDANAMLEVCNGYTQAEAPDMKVLNTVLYNLTVTYEKIYRELCDREENE